ncbi:Complex1-LYR-dom domain-containing protein [Aphelenchoides besseyi]|nr:Complex1-LYR-dom domain-containing protein [Aphelenchoides besseyi]KAI6210394.1 Complex1-LYR-dom domain-containing protein [Aphelenchoides besseyi]
MLRTEVLRLYGRILRIAKRWEAKEATKTAAEREFIRSEAAKQFRANKHIEDSEEVAKLIRETEERIEICIHYRTPFERPTYLNPGTSFGFRRSSKFDTPTRQKLHSAIDRLTSDQQQIFRFYFANSPLTFDLNLKPLLDVDEEMLALLLSSGFKFKSKFQKVFFKKCVDLFQTQDRHSDSLYEALCSSMALADGPFCRYFCGKSLSEDLLLKERPEAISSGTTGLSSWVASYVLANHLIQRENLDNQLLVELGSGCGLAGLASLRYHRLRSLWLTDIDEKVLEQLRENVELNFASDIRIRVQNCDFGDRKSLDRLPQQIDLIIAADLIYDVELADRLIDAFSHLNFGRILVAATERNVETLDHFRRALTQQNYNYTSRLYTVGTNQIAGSDGDLQTLIPPISCGEKVFLFEIHC